MLTMENIQKSFNVGTPDEAILFDGFNFAVNDGDFISVIGSNGSGKTTLLNLICGTLQPDGGTIRFHNRDITHMREHGRAAFIGRVFQDPKAGTCAGLTILENLALADNKGKQYGLGFAIDKKRQNYYKQLLEQCEMGLENRLSTQVGALSGGQRQALALVIANMTKVELLILDEHTAALDPKSSETIMRLTDKIIRAQHITTVMVTHNLRYAVDYGSRLVMMHEGKAMLDLQGEAKHKTKVETLLDVFSQISIELGN
ncbi:MAG: ATP-binding cassette domain-containing protein [Clostridia bacterium]|nr:ATP-binding cassette domain-containing protein [Candidatus Pelethousia sp.]NCB30949.1 ATP-binding cassette domain-containing protein [Clostridia bacterium]